MTVRSWSMCAAVAAFLILPFLAGLGTVEAKIVVPSSGSVIDVHATTLEAVVDIFEDAEDTIKTHDLEKVMAVYSRHYNYPGFKKDDLRKIWEALFDEYQEIASTHLFTKMTKVGSGRDDVLEVICTGHLSARSQTSGLYVPIDNRYEEAHYFVLEDGTWRIRGDVGESPRVLLFGTAPHPLFEI